MSIAALQAQLRRDPQDLESWLVYADHLLQEGDVRGQLVQLEHQKASLPEPQASELQEEIDRIVSENQRTWDNLLPERISAQHLHGFLVGITLRWDGSTSEILEPLLESPHARLLSTLRLRVPLDEEPDEEDEEDDDAPLEVSDRVRDLLSLDLRQLTALDVAYARLNAQEIAALVSSARLGPLDALDLRYNRVKDRGAAALAEAPIARGLVSLRLQRAEIGPEGAAALAASSGLRRLSLLDLRDNPIGPLGASALAGSPVLAGLGTLLLHRSDVGPKAAPPRSRAARAGCRRASRG